MAETTLSGTLAILGAVGEAQDGYFTASQATEQGVTYAELHRLAGRGLLDRELWSVYRFAQWPLPKHPGLWPIVLWAQARCSLVALSHETALQLHGLTDVNPSQVHLTFSGPYRIRGTLPPALKLYFRELSRADVDDVDNLPVTTLYRTLLDLLVVGRARDSVGEVLSAGERRGLSGEQYRTISGLYNLAPEAFEHIMLYGGDNSVTGNRAR